MMKNKLKTLKNKKFHFIGIGGISMSALAQILKKNRFYVQGSDEKFSEEVKNLNKKNIRVFIGHKEENVYQADVVVVSSAIHQDNVEYQYAVKNNLIIIKRAELLGYIAENYKMVIAVAGSHGKTTTTAMISEMFIRANLKPTIHLGGELKSINSNYKIGNKQFFITENCEYMDNFLKVSPDISVILNIDSDHLDYFKNLEGVKTSFLTYAKQTKEGGINIVCDIDENSKELLNLDNIATFGVNKNSDIFAKNISEYKPGYFSFDVLFEKYYMGNIKLNVVGKHNIFNALASIFVGLVCGIDFCDIKESIESFSGVKRRCEYWGELNGANIYHDYAHHPKQIESMITSFRRIVQDGKLIVVFEPHTFSRTKYLLKDFAESLSKSDYLILSPVYSAREKESDGLTSKDLMTETKKFLNKVELIDNFKGIKERLNEIVKAGDYVLILGAGTIENIGKVIFEKK